MRNGRDKEAPLTADRLRELFSYDADTGVLSWKNPTNRRLSKHPEAGTLNEKGYRIVVVDGVNYRAHRLIWLYVHGNWPVVDIDHINGVRGDNRLVNLREATVTQNNANRRAQGGRPLKGIYFCKWLQRWRAQISINKKNYSLGSFDTAQEAHAAYAAKARDVHGEFARDG